MSLSPENIKRAVSKAINVNPTEIQIKQTIKTKKDGHFEENETNKTLIVIIFQSSSKTDLEKKSVTMGTSHKSKNYNMIADYNANLEVNTLNAVEFDCIEGHMKIIDVSPIVIQNVICGYECSLERID